MSSILGEVLGSLFNNPAGARADPQLQQGGAPGGVGGLGGGDPGDAGGAGSPGGLGGLLGGLGSLGGMGGMGGMGGTGGMGGLGGGALGGLLGGLLGAGRDGRGGMGARGALIGMLLPLALQWMQRNGGLSGMLEKFGQHGYQSHTQSWLGTGDNQALDAGAVDQVMGHDEIAAMARQLGVAPAEVSQGMAELLPEVANQMTPDGQLPPDGHDALDHALGELSRMT